MSQASRTIPELSDLRVIDTDTHLTEPPDLWTARVASKHRDRAPRVEVDESTGLHRWVLDGRWLSPVGLQSHAGWKEYAPSVPPSFEEIEAACYDPDRRVDWMDQHGIHTQILYPNLVAFEAHAIMALRDRELEVALIQAYNDHVHEFASSHPGRFIGVASLPFWDIDASIAELVRCHAMGHRGVLWASTLEQHGLPGLSDPHWHRLYAIAEELGMSINFHVGVGHTQEELEELLNIGGNRDDRMQRAEFTATFFTNNAKTIAHVLMSGLCEAFPRLGFVSVESGFGFVPFLVEGLDWAWKTNGGFRAHPELLLPSEYFRRQVYTTFWFEQTTLPLLELFPDNVLFETDFPHKTSLSPGPGTTAPSPRELIANALARFGEPLIRKVLHDNAARLYRLS